MSFVTASIVACAARRSARVSSSDVPSTSSAGGPDAPAADGSAAPQTRPSQRCMPSIPVGFHGPPWSHGPMNIRKARIVSAP